MAAHDETPEARLRRMEARLDALARRLEALERRLGPETAGPAPAPRAANPKAPWPDDVDDT